MGTDLSKCGQRGYGNRGCKLENFKECSDLQGSELLGLGVRRGRVQIAEDSKRAGDPTLQQIKKLDWSNFKMYEGLCYKRLTDKPRGKVSWSLYRHSAAVPTATQVSMASGTDTAGDGEKSLIDEIFDPIEKGLELAMKGKFDKAMETVGAPRVAGLAVSGLLGIVILVSLARLPFKVAKKNKAKRIEAERQDVVREKREAEARRERGREAELQTHRRVAMEAQARAEEAELCAEKANDAVQEALRKAREIAESREPTPIPLSLPTTEETPLPLMQPKAFVIESVMDYPAGRVDDNTDPAVPKIIIEVVLDIAERGDKPLLEIERNNGLIISMAQVKKAALLAQFHPITDQSPMQTTADILAVACEAYAEKGAEALSDHALKKTVTYMSEGKVTGEMIDGTWGAYRTYIESKEWETEVYREEMRLAEGRATMVPGGGEVTPNVGTVTAEPPTRQVDLRSDGTPPSGSPRQAQSVTTDVVPERLAEEAAVQGARRGAAAAEFMFVDDSHRHDPDEAKFSPDQIAELEKAIEFAPKGSLPLVAGPADGRYLDASIVMENAKKILVKESEQFGNPDDKMKIEIANRFTDAVKQVPGFAKAYYGGGKGRELNREGLKVVADLVRFMNEDKDHKGLGKEGRKIAERQYLTGFLASEEVQGRYFELRENVDPVSMSLAKEVVDGSARSAGRGKRPSGRVAERRKERSGRHEDPLANDPKFEKFRKKGSKKHVK